MNIEQNMFSTEIVDAPLYPRFIYNNSNRKIKISNELNRQMKECDTFSFSIAFIADSGLAAIRQSLLELKARNIKGRIITSTYLGFNQPKMFRQLMALENVEVRIYQKEGFHPKGYIFQKGSKCNVIVGSSNLTQSALSVNQEWNIGLTSDLDSEIVTQVISEFEKQWNDEDTKLLSDEWITSYEATYIQPRTYTNPNPITNEIKPNKMQKEALLSLGNLRNNQKDKALLISATGTGKTYLSAFDVKDVDPKRMLFVVHRENIARTAMKTFKNIIKNHSMGMFSGHNRDGENDYLFATIQTIGKDEYLNKFNPDEFDYIVIDEVHKAGANMYQNLIKYFKPKFLLGMSATPERSDGINIYQLFDYNIAYEIRLQQAMEYDLLCPFHYYGISDLVINGEQVEDDTSFNYLTSNDRVEHIIDAIHKYGFSGDKVRGLIFCSRNDIADNLSKQFNERGYRTVSLAGSDSDKVRTDAMNRLELEECEDALDYIFTVDIFNEGIDIPKVNQVIMLRPTQSAIIFVQQLGRGLRKNDSKEYVVVIDFIGNYKNNFMIPIALSGDKSYNKDNIRNYLFEENSLIPGCSTISFDEVSREKIFQSIDKIVTKKALLTGKYKKLKEQFGKIPTIYNFYEYGEIDPLLFINYSKSYHNFLMKNEKEYISNFDKNQEVILEFISKYMAEGKREEELLLMNELIECRKIDETSYLKNKDAFDSALNIIKGCFFNRPEEIKRYKNMSIINDDKSISKSFEFYLEDIQFKIQLLDIIKLGLARFNDIYSKDLDENGFSFYQRYSRKDVCKILNWDKDNSSTIYGYTVKDNSCPIFVTYEKKEDISESTKYEDTFIHPGMFSWMTRSNVSLDSREAKAIINYKESGLIMPLFIKKSDGEGSDFYYMGLVEPCEWNQSTIINDAGKELPIVNFKMRMSHMVRQDIYDYLEK